MQLMLLGLLKITRGVMKKKLIKLTDNEIKILISKLDGWSFKDGKISKKFNTKLASYLNGHFNDFLLM